jgi:hypothetical protein
MSRRYALPLSVVLSALCLNGVAYADCGAPEILVEPAIAAAGSTVVVTGRALREPGICRDAGCGLRPSAGPAKDVRLVLAVEGGNSVRLGSLPDDDTYERIRQVQLPNDLPPGEASLQAVRGDGVVLATTPLRVVADSS